jgi:hydroxymethylglutaryl-CoA reductase
MEPPTVEKTLDKNLGDLLKGFSKLNREQRFQTLTDLGFLDLDDVSFLKAGAPVAPELAEHFIENVIGFFQMPLGVATNFRIDGQDYIIPMAVEETSIIAAASKTAKWVRDTGECRTGVVGDCIIGQIQVSKLLNPENFKTNIEKSRIELINRCNEIAAGLCRRGGGFKDISVRILDRADGKKMGVLHLYANPVDAMGANIMNQVCEGLKPFIEILTGETVTMCILSNLVDSKLTRAEILIRGIDPEIGHGIEEASYFSQLDPYRAATNNKGVLNGIDPILIATGNDWRAVEAGVHAFAARSGQYTSITRWKMVGRDLLGVFEAPVIVGTVGGVTRLHPTAKMSLKILKVETAESLSRICAAVGLMQNLGALKALSTVGVVQGHMNLHTANLAMMAGATGDEVSAVQKQLQGLLAQQKKISLAEASFALEKIRSRGDSLALQPTQ